MYSTCLHCEVAWDGDAACWVCGYPPPSYMPRPHILMTASAHSWRYDEDGDQDLAEPGLL
jgi:hypothetical protein